jgi:hypothetical protein
MSLSRIGAPPFVQLVLLYAAPFPILYAHAAFRTFDFFPLFVFTTMLAQVARINAAFLLNVSFAV